MKINDHPNGATKQLKQTTPKNTYCPEHKQKKEPTVTITIKTENRHTTRHMPFSKQAAKKGPLKSTQAKQTKMQLPPPPHAKESITHNAH